MLAWLSSMRTGMRLQLGFGVLIALLLGLGAYSMVSAQRQGRLLDDMYSNRMISVTLVEDASLNAVYHNRTLYSLAAEQDTGVIDDIVREMGEYEAKVRQSLDAYAQTSIEPAEAEALKKIRENWPAYADKVGEIASVSRSGNTGSAMMMVQGSVQNIFRLIEQDLAEIVRLNKERAKESAAEGASIAKRIFLVTTALMALAVVFGVGVAVAVTRTIVVPLSGAVREMRRLAAGDMTAEIKVVGADESAAMMRSLKEVQQELSGLVAQIQGTARQLQSSVVAVTDSTHQLSARAGESSDAVSSAAAALEELVVSIDLVGNNADAASERAREAGDAASQGRHLGEAAAGDVAVAADKVATTADMIQNLSAQVDEIGTIANVIKDIADQTNLLALNAAIEAARAGEQGRGFAVVADEVRKLAERTTVSAQEITRTIQSIQGGTGAVVESMVASRGTMEGVRSKVGETTTAIHGIESSAGSALVAVGEISTALREQKATSAGIARNVESVARLSEDNARTAESVSSAMADVRRMAEELAAITQRFKLRSAP